MNDAKLQRSFSLLEAALGFLEEQPENAVAHAAVAKAFESTFEYVWKEFKRRAEEAGLEVYSPRDAIKAAMQLGLITDLDQWNGFLNARNLSVHDYVGLEDSEMRDRVRAFYDEMHRLLNA